MKPTGYVVAIMNTNWSNPIFHQMFAVESDAINAVNELKKQMPENRYYVAYTATHRVNPMTDQSFQMTADELAGRAMILAGTSI